MGNADVSLLLLSSQGVFGWRCNCGSNALSLLKGTAADYTVRCGCGLVFRVRLEEVTSLPAWCPVSRSVSAGSQVTRHTPLADHWIVNVPLVTAAPVAKLLWQMPCLATGAASVSS